jgi:diguanylate cyclase (GGDEF)-like protein/PAS domain S-box-containing protein
MTIRRLVCAYGAWMAALTVAYYALPSARGVSAASAALTGSAAIIYGVRRYQPARRWAWLLLAASLPLSAAARLVYLLPGPVGALRPSYVAAYVLHVAMAIALLAALLGLARLRGRGRLQLIDAAILLLGAGLLAGVLIALPYATAADIPTIQALARVGYVLRDVLILTAAVHLVTSVRWTATVALIFAGTVGFLTQDLLFRIARIRGELLIGTVVDLGWLFFFASVGAAALVPSMAALGAPGRPGPQASLSLRLGLVAAAASLPFALLLIGAFGSPQSFSGSPQREPVIAVISSLILSLVLARMVGVALQLRRQVAGERVLREGIGDIGAAADLDAVAGALTSAVRHLAPAGVACEVSIDAAGAEAGQVQTRPPDSAQTAAFPLGPDRSAAPSAGLILRVTMSDRTALAALRPRLQVLAAQAAAVLERIRLNEEIIRRSNEAHFRTLVANSADVILMLDDEDRIELASPSAVSIFGSRPLQGVWLPDLIAEADRAGARQLLIRARAGTHEWVSLSDWAVRGPGGVSRALEVTARHVSDEASVRGLVVTLRDVTEQRRLEQALTEGALHDPLTGLANRLQTRQRIGQAVDRAARSGTVAGLLLIDLDDFKMVNEQLGHEAGDAVLKAVGHRLREAVPPGCLAARVGGDEFSVVVEPAADAAAVDEVALKVVAALSRPIQLRHHVVPGSVSVGVATTAEADSATDLSRNADLSLYAAKAAGRGQWRHYDPSVRSAIVDRLELRTSLSSALKHGALTLEYQPIVRLGTGSTAGFEALLRWNHPTRGQLSPDAFIEIAEESGDIIPIGDWALATAAREAQRWASTLPDDPPFVAVNVSARQFRSHGFVDRVRRVLAETGLAPQRLHLEITESLLLRDDERVWQDLQRLRDLGVRIAIDDFGTGYSALSYLRQVPLDLVKLDRQFVHTMSLSNQQRDLVAGIVGLAKILRLAVVAEGIETEIERDLAVSVGCRFGQGFHFARPMPAESAQRWLEGERAARRGSVHDHAVVGEGASSIHGS